MFKKIISFLLVLLVVVSIPFSALAATVSIVVSDDSGATLVTVSQGGSSLYSQVGSSSTSITVDDSTSISVNVSGFPTYYYPTINGTFATSSSLDANVGTITVAVKKLTPPSITLSINAKGGVAYEISNNTPITSFDIEIFENNNPKSTVSVTSTSGVLPNTSEGKSYSAQARVNGFSYVSEMGPRSNSVTVPTSYSLIVKSSDGGTITDVSESYIAGSTISLSAAASTGYVFVEWSSNGGGEFADAKSRETTFTMPAKNVTVTASFGKTYKFVIMSSTGGKVWDVDGNYYEGQQVKVSAIPGDGYVFDSWVSSDGGKFEDSKAVATLFTMPGNATTVTATFKESSAQTNKPEDNEPGEAIDNDSGMFEIKTSVIGNGNIVIIQNKGHEGQKITVRATAQAGYTFDSWSSEGGGSFADMNAAATTFIMPDGDVTIIATFIQGDVMPVVDETPVDDSSKEPPSKSLFIIIGVGVVVAAAVVVGILLVLKERAKRRAAYEEDDSYFSDYRDEHVIYDYDDATGEIQYEAQTEPEEYEEREEVKGNNQNSWRQQRKRRNQYSDNIYKADDWED